MITAFFRRHGAVFAWASEITSFLANFSSCIRFLTVCRCHHRTPSAIRRASPGSVKRAGAFPIQSGKLRQKSMRKSAYSATLKIEQGGGNREKYGILTCPHRVAKRHGTIVHGRLTFFNTPKSHKRPFPTKFHATGAQFSVSRTKARAADAGDGGSAR